MRIVLVALFANLLFAQPELFLVDENNKQVRSVQVDPVEVQASFTVPNNPAFFFVNADRTKYYSVSRAAAGTVAVLSAAQPSTVLKTLDLAAITTAAITPDRRYLLLAGAQAVHLVDTATDEATTVPTGGPVTALAVSLDGSRAFALTTQVLIINLTTRTVVGSTALSVSPHALAINHTGLLYASAQSRVYELDSRTGQLRRTIEVAGRPGQLAFSPSSYVALAGNLAPNGPSLFRFDLKSGVVDGSLTLPFVPIREVHFLDEHRAVALSNQSVTQIPIQVDPLSSPLVAQNAESFQTIVRSPEFPNPRELYRFSQGITAKIDTEAFPGPSPVSYGVQGSPFLAPVTTVGASTHLYAFNGDQTAPPGQPYPLPLIARVTNRIGRPVSNVVVRFSNGQSAVSNHEGWVVVTANAPSSGGPVAITSTADAARATFRLGALPAPPAAITILEGQGQLMTFTQTPRPLRIAVHDSAGFPVPGQDVTFSAPTGAAEFVCVGRRLCTLRTDGSGIVFLAMNLGNGYGESDFEQQQIEIASGAAPRRIVYLTVGNVEVHRVPSTRSVLLGMVYTAISNAFEFQFHVRTPLWLYQPLANIGFLYRPSPAFPDLSCIGESGLVLSDADGSAKCGLSLGGQSGVALLQTAVRIGGRPDSSGRFFADTITILNPGLPVIQVLSGAQQVLRLGQPPAPIVIRLVDQSGIPMPNVPLTWSVETPHSNMLRLDSFSAVSGSDGSASAQVGVTGFGDYTAIVRVRALGTHAVIPIYVAGSGDAPSRSSRQLPGFAGRTSIPVTTAGPWNIQGLPSWLRARPSSGIGPGTVWLEFDANSSFTAPRTAVLTIGFNQLDLEQSPRPRPAVIAGDVTASTGTAATFLVVFDSWSDPNPLNVLNVLIQDSLSGRNACYIAYSVPSRVLYLVSDQGPDTLSPPIALPSPQTLSNSQCTIHGAESFVQISGRIVTLVLSVSFTPSFAGPKLVYAGASDLLGASSGWSIAAVHTVPGPASWPRPLGATRSSAFTAADYINFEFEDATDARNLETVWALANSTLDGAGACYFAYHVPSNQVFLFPDSGLAAGITSAVLGTGYILSNSSCTISAFSAAVSFSGPRLQLKLGVSYLPNSGAPPRAIWLAAQTLSGRRSTWQPLAMAGFN
jgi:hypothetical protein